MRRDSNPRPSPWQGDTPPLSHSCIYYSVALFSNVVQRRVISYNINPILSIDFFRFFSIFYKIIQISKLISLIKTFQSLAASAFHNICITSQHNRSDMQKPSVRITLGFFYHHFFITIL